MLLWISFVFRLIIKTNKNKLHIKNKRTNVEVKGKHVRETSLGCN